MWKISYICAVILPYFPRQWGNIEKSIKRVIPIDKSRIDQYKLFYGKDSEFEAKKEKRDKLIRYIRHNLKKTNIGFHQGSYRWSQRN